MHHMTLENERWIDQLASVERDQHRLLAAESLQSTQVVGDGRGVSVIAQPVVPRCPRLRADGQQRFIAVEHHVIGGVWNACKHVTFDLVRILHDRQRLIRVTGQNDVVEMNGVTPGERDPSTSDSRDTASTDRSPPRKPVRREHGLDVGPGSAPDRSPDGPPTQLQHPVVGHEAATRTRRGTNRNHGWNMTTSMTRWAAGSVRGPGDRCDGRTPCTERTCGRTRVIRQGPGGDAIEPKNAQQHLPVGR